MRRILGVKLSECSNMDEYVGEIIKTSQRLAEMGSPLDDELVGVIMLSGLTSEYDPMVMALESTNQKISSDLVKGKLLQEHTERISKVENALYSGYKKKFIPKQGNKRRLHQIVCFRCKKTGHYQNKCPNKREKEQNALHVCLTVSKDKRDEWVVDPGATAHMSCRQDWLEHYKQKDLTVTVADNNEIECKGVGIAKIDTYDILNVLHVPSLNTNLLSVNQIVSKGLIVVFQQNKCQILNRDGFHIKGDVMLEGYNEGGLFKLRSTDSAMLTTEKEVKNLWHRRLGHINRISLKLLSDGLATGIKYSEENTEPCVACVEGKMARLPFLKRKMPKRAEGLLDLIHSDVCGPMPEKSWSNARYFLTMIDDHSRKIFVFFLKSKEDVKNAIINFVNRVETEIGKKVKKIRSDNGREYVNKTLENYFQSKGIIHEKTVPYNPEQNGLAERVNRTLTEMARSMMKQGNCTDRMWAEAVNTACYLKNCSPHKALPATTPEQVWSNRKVDVSHLRVFGCVAYNHVPDQLRRKWESKSKPLVMVGYDEESKGYRLMDPVSHSIVKGRNVKFFENTYWSWKNTNTRDNLPILDMLPQCDSSSIPEKDVNQKSDEFSSAVSDEEPVLSGRSCAEAPADAPKQGCNDVAEASAGAYPQRSTRVRKRTQFFAEYVACMAVVNDPISLKEAMMRDDCDKWKSAMESEYDSLCKNNTWTLVNRPSDVNVVRCKWVYKQKELPDGQIKYKARLVAMGFTQEYGIDYMETFSPVVRNSTLRLMFSIAVYKNLQIYHYDVETAFLHGKLEESVFMEQPEMFVKPENHLKVCLLNRAIYGLKQSSRVWNQLVVKVLTDYGFKQSIHEPCIFTKFEGDIIVIITLYVDDFLIFTNCILEKEKLSKMLCENFNIKDLGLIKNILGNRIERDNKGISIDQKGYILSLLEKFEMSQCKSVKTPLIPNLRLERSETVDYNLPYQELIGKLMYLAINSRPDIAYSVNFMSQFNTCYNSVHWNHLKRVLRYLKGTIDYKLRFNYNKKFELVCHVDADWANDLDRKSYSGILFTLGGNPIHWAATKQRCIALSTAEAEFVSMCEAAKDAIYFKELFLELGVNIDNIKIFNDNQSALALSGSGYRFSNRTKHIGVRFYFVKNLIEQGVITVEYKPSELMLADVFTKSLSFVKLLLCCEGMRLTD